MITSNQVNLSFNSPLSNQSIGTEKKMQRQTLRPYHPHWDEQASENGLIQLNLIPESKTIKSVNPNRIPELEPCEQLLQGTGVNIERMGTSIHNLQRDNTLSRRNIQQPEHMNLHNYEILVNFKKSGCTINDNIMRAFNLQNSETLKKMQLFNDTLNTFPEKTNNMLNTYLLVGGVTVSLLGIIYYINKSTPSNDVKDSGIIK